MFGRIKAFFNKLVYFFVGLIAFSFVTCFAIISAGDFNNPTRGITVSGIIVFLIWGFCVYLIVKGHPLIPTIGMFVLFIGTSVAKYGVDFNMTSELGEILSKVIMLVIIFGFLYHWARKSQEEEDEKKKRLKKAKESGKAYCPYCYSTSIVYYALGVPWMDYDDIQFSSSKHYHCKRCGRDF